MILVEVFKNELKNYNFYKEKIKSITNELDAKWYELSGVKGIRYDKEPCHSFNPSLSEEMKLSLMEQISIIENDLLRIKANVLFIDSMLNKINEETRKWIKMIYFDGMTYDKVSKIANFSKNGLAYRINTAIEKALNEEI